MNILLIVAFLFYVGSIVGYILDVIFRRFLSKPRKWTNAGFLIGPYEPIYGFGLIILFGISCLDFSFIGSNTLSVLFEILLMAIGVIILEYVTGTIFIKCLNIKLWDHSDRWGHVQGIISPVYVFMWTTVCVIYFFFIHPSIINAVIWLSNNMTFSFFIGFFFGILFTDLVYTMYVVLKIRKFAKEKGIYIHYYPLKESMSEYDKKHNISTKTTLLLDTRLIDLDKKLEYYQEHILKKPIVKDDSVDEV